MAIQPENAPTSADELRGYLDRVNRQLATVVNKNVATAYGGMSQYPSSGVAVEVTSTPQVITNYDTVMPQAARSLPDGIVVDTSAGTLRVKSAGVYRVDFTTAGEYQPDAAIDGLLFSIYRDSSLIATANAPNSANGQCSCSMFALVNMEKGETLDVRVRTTNAGEWDQVSVMFCAHRISEAFD